MALDSITNFVTPKATVLAWVNTRLVAETSIWTSVRIFEGQDWNRLYHFLPEVQPPSCVIVYTGSKYGRKPRATVNFSVVVVNRNFRSKATIQPTVVVMIDRAIALLDHEICNSHGVCTVVSDEWINLWNNNTEGTSAYKIDFQIEDY